MKMNRYKIRITEAFVREIEVEAEDMDTAEETVIRGLDSGSEFCCADCGGNYSRDIEFVERRELTE